MRILHIIDSLRPGGAQELVATIINHAGGQIRYHCASFVGPDAIGEELLAKGTPVTYLSSHKYCLPVAIVKMKRALRQVQPDVVNLHLECSTLMGLLFEAGRRERRTVVTIHALREQLPRWFYPLFKRLVHRADGVVVEDHIAREQVAALGYPGRQIHYIPIGTDYLDRRAEWQGRAPGIRDEFGVSESAPVILNIARLHPIKGQEHLLRAFERVRRRVPKCRLLIVGYGPRERALKDLAARLGLGNSVIFAGLRRDLERFYMDADVFVMTSLQENMGVVIYQAMAMGLPIVSYDAGSIKEIVEDKRTGFLVKSGDTDSLAGQMADVLQAPDSFRTTIGAAARRVIETEYSGEVMTRRYEAVYRGLWGR